MRDRRDRDGGARSFGSDPEVFEAFYREHVDAVERFVARRVRDRDVAADLTADVFVAAIEAADAYDPSRGAPVAWLYGIAQLVVASRRRRTGREHRANAQVRGRELLDLDDMARIDDRIAAEEQSRRLYRAMDCLPEGERAVLELVAVDELSLAEAALALGVRSVTARVRFHRARRRMADQLSGALADELSPLLTHAKETSP
jgi:RNA polymerase sigma-70 factor (ECF subfamily)